MPIAILVVVAVGLVALGLMASWWWENCRELPPGQRNLIRGNIRRVALGFGAVFGLGYVWWVLTAGPEPGDYPGEDFSQMPWWWECFSGSVRVASGCHRADLGDYLSVWGIGVAVAAVTAIVVGWLISELVGVLYWIVSTDRSADIRGALLEMNTTLVIIGGKVDELGWSLAEIESRVDSKPGVVARVRAAIQVLRRSVNRRWSRR